MTPFWFPDISPKISFPKEIYSTCVSKMALEKRSKTSLKKIWVKLQTKIQAIPNEYGTYQSKNDLLGYLRTIGHNIYCIDSIKMWCYISKRIEFEILVFGKEVIGKEVIGRKVFGKNNSFRYCGNNVFGEKVSGRNIFGWILFRKKVFRKMRERSIFDIYSNCTIIYSRYFNFFIWN